MAYDGVRVNDIDCENLVLGTMMCNITAASSVRDILDKDCFYTNEHQEIYSCILECMDDGSVPDMINVFALLQKKGSSVQAYVIASICEKSVLGEIIDYAIRLKELSIRRRLWLLGQQLVLAGTSEVTSLTEIQQSAMVSLTDIFAGNTTNVKTLAYYIDEMYEHIKRNLSMESSITGTPTGFHALDMKGGLQKGSLVIVAGESSQGKSSLAFNIASNAAQSGAVIAAYSLEMTGRELAARIVSGYSGVSSSAINYSHTISSEELQSIDNATAVLKGNNILFDDRSNSNLETILTSIRSLKLKFNIDGVIIDFLQILNVNDKSNNPEQAMGYAARMFKNIAKDLDIWVIALSQLNRDKDNPVPSLARLRSSGQIQEAADMVMLVYRPEVYGKHFPEPFESASTYGMAMINVAKGRNTGTFKFLCRFDAPTTRFTDIESVYDVQIPQRDRDDAPF